MKKVVLEKSLSPVIVFYGFCTNPDKISSVDLI